MFHPPLSLIPVIFTGLKKYDDISSAPLADRNLVGNVVFSTPIAIIVPHGDHDMDLVDSFVMTLESLIHQPGINTENVYVFYNQSSILVAEIAQLFRFHLFSLNMSKNNDDFCK